MAVGVVIDGTLQTFTVRDTGDAEPNFSLTFNFSECEFEKMPPSLRGTEAWVARFLDGDTVSVEQLRDRLDM